MTYIIAEIGINHNGSIDLAKELIDQAKSSGCHAVKFQKRTIDLVYTKEELDQYRESPWGTTNREQKEGLEFSLEQYKELEEYSIQKDLDFIVSCWDTQSIDDIEKTCNVKYHKVASALATDRNFLDKLNSTGKPIILSVGMCDQPRVDAAIKALDNVEYVLGCTSTYPTKPEDVNLNYIKSLKKQYPNLKIGFSNHYNGADACVGAVALGADCIEFHITKNRAMYGSDQAASIQHTQAFIDAIKKIKVMLGDGSKNIVKDELPIAKKLRKVDNIV
tara:strand:- start:1779 stop:2606 length:828 start_codon:yes stop_codon:yes gene_type:complete